jgi:hypothetical protein
MSDNRPPGPPTIEESLEYLRQLEQFRVLVEYVEAGREELIGAFKVAEPDKLLKLSGEVYAHDTLLNLLKG